MARHVRLVALAAACVLLAGACGTSSNTASSGASGSSGGSGSGGTLVIGMTATNIPGLDTGMFQSEGGEGGRFVGV
jgi:peptide/nickel transport system substrate-binding protein